MDKKDKLFVVNEVCELKNCNKCIFFEMRRKRDLYLWLSAVPHGPSAKFLVENIQTMDELKLRGNCLRGSRPLLAFDKAMEESPHYEILKELFKQVFGTPNKHPKSKPFFDHVFSFSLADERIWFRNYQIVEGGTSLVEIGPRFTLNLIRVFDGSFGGATLYENPHYQSPNDYRRSLMKQAGMRYRDRQLARDHKKKQAEEVAQAYSDDEVEDVFAEAVEGR